MSFRFRLTLFFMVIVIVPMIAVAFVLFRVVADSEEGKSDARLGQAQRTASGLYETLQRRAFDAAAAIGADQELSAAIAADDRARIEARLRALGRREQVVRIVMRLDDRGRYVVGREDAVAVARRGLLEPSGERIGDLDAATVTAADLAEQTERLTGMEVVIRRDGRVLAATLPEVPAGLPADGPVDVAGRDMRVAGFKAEVPGGGEVDVRVLADQRKARSNVGSSTLKVAIALAAFLLLAFLFAITVSRSLQAQIARLLRAARKLGQGDFDVDVPTEGHDEFAQLGSTFNQMAGQMRDRVEDLQREQTRLQLAIRRVGDSFGRALDREALLDTAVQTAVDGVGARCGRASIHEGGRELRVVAVQGDVDGFDRAMQAAEIAVLNAGEGVETQVGETSVLSEPLLAEGDDRVLGMITVARRGSPFSTGERDLFHYLAGQAAISIENADLHQAVRRQAVTDELTGLFNHRHFQEVMSAEVERARRYGQQVALIMLDIDNFKAINDTHGHMQGDLVLREVARVVQESAREIDEPARYGGEELAVVLPQTDLEGAYRFGERVRERIERLEVPLLDRSGMIRVTASVGVAAAPGDGRADKDELVSAADAALYRAKRSGKNRTVRAG